MRQKTFDEIASSIIDKKLKKRKFIRKITDIHGNEVEIEDTQLRDFADAYLRGIAEAKIAIKAKTDGLLQMGFSEKEIGNIVNDILKSIG